jgi:hypothetical protein
MVCVLGVDVEALVVEYVGGACGECRESPGELSLYRRDIAGPIAVIGLRVIVIMCDSGCGCLRGSVCTMRKGSSTLLSHGQRCAFSSRAAAATQTERGISCIKPGGMWPKMRKRNEDIQR